MKKYLLDIENIYSSSSQALHSKVALKPRFTNTLGFFILRMYSTYWLYLFTSTLSINTITRVNVICWSKSLIYTNISED